MFRVNYWGQPYSEQQAAHISNLAKYSKYPVKTPQPSDWRGVPGTGWRESAENSSCSAFIPEGTQIGPKIPVPLDKHAGHRIRQAFQGLNTVQEEVRGEDCHRRGQHRQGRGGLLRRDRDPHQAVRGEERAGARPQLRRLRCPGYH